MKGEDDMRDTIGTKAFAEKWGCSQATVAKWCRGRDIDGVDQDGKGSPWRIPIDAKPPESYLKRKGLK